MPLPLKPNDIVLAVKDALQQYVAARKGKISIANNPFEAMEILGETPVGFRVIILWEGDEDATGQPLAGIVYNTISVIVSHNRGLRMWRGENLHIPQGELPALMDLVTEMRTIIRDKVWPDAVTEGSLLYLGTQPEITPEGFPLDAYRSRYRLTTVIPYQLP